MTVVCADDEAVTTDELLRRLRRGDPDVFNLLFALHAGPLTRFVSRMVSSPHVAAELVQDVFLRLWSGRSTLKIRGDLRSYLRRAARNRALDWLRREDLHREWEQSAASEMRAWSAEAQGAEQDRIAQMRDVLAQTLDAMPDRRREVCQLRWRRGIGPAAIAEQLGVSLKTVETHITRGLKDLRAGLRARRSLP